MANSITYRRQESGLVVLIVLRLLWEELRLGGGISIVCHGGELRTVVSDQHTFYVSASSLDKDR